MNLREILTNAGVEENTIKTIETAMKANNVYITNEQNADIRIKKFKEKQESLENDLSEALRKNDEYEDLSGKNKTLTSEIETLKREAADKEFNFILDNALKGYKVKDDKLVKALLDREKIKLTDGKLEGLEEQINSIKTERGFLFEREKGAPDFTTGGKSGVNNQKGDDISAGTRLGKQRAEQLSNAGITDFIK